MNFLVFIKFTYITVISSENTMINKVEFRKNILIISIFLKNINKFQDKIQNFCYNFHKLHTKMDCFLAFFINLIRID